MASCTGRAEQLKIVSTVLSIGDRGVADVGALIMLGTLFGLIALVFGVVLRYDPEARRPPSGAGDA